MDRAYPSGPLPYLYDQFFTGPFRLLCEHSKFPYETSPETYDQARALVDQWGRHSRVDPSDWLFGAMLEALRSRRNSAYANLRDAREAIGQRLNRDLRLTRYERDI